MVSSDITDHRTDNCPSPESTGTQVSGLQWLVFVNTTSKFEPRKICLSRVEDGDCGDLKH